ncbi:hypothetical protein [Streptomyces sp. NPDC016845]|uniref:hypothetical protein n=1 Tax=Streptomyces sp. NPDC016845 TaxID=3364972 RepID=UPI0037ACEB09
MMLAAADSPGEHLQLAAFTAACAFFFIGWGRRQRRTGRSLIAQTETVQVGNQLVPPPPASRLRRAAGTEYIVAGGVFVIPAVFNFAAAIHALVR